VEKYFHEIDKTSLNAPLYTLVAEAYRKVSDGYSIDRIIADPNRNARFIQQCWKLGVKAAQFDLNLTLLNARKKGLIGRVEGVERYRVPRAELDSYLFASEFAIRRVQDEEMEACQRRVSLDHILCDPKLSSRFEAHAREIVPGYESLDYRWAALCLRKSQNRTLWRDRIAFPRFEVLGRCEAITTSRIPAVQGYFWINSDSSDLYIGHAEDLRKQIERMLDLRIHQRLAFGSLFEQVDPKHVQIAVAACPGVPPSSREPRKTELVQAKQPLLNVLRINRRTDPEGSPSGRSGRRVA
jgi:site-specific DNA-methyltransferase (adenine-specific)